MVAYTFMIQLSGLHQEGMQIILPNCMVTVECGTDHCWNVIESHKWNKFQQQSYT
jgi:hypothetical protein